LASLAAPASRREADMSIVLASTWRRRGEGPRLQRLRRRLEATYERIVVALPPGGDPAQAAPIRAWPTVGLIASPQIGWGRYLALQFVLQTTASHVHCADLDMLVGWIEARPDEWSAMIDLIQTGDCVIAGRSDRAFATRPQAIQRTERIINAVASDLLGQPVDCGLGSRGFSRRAAECVLRNSAPGGYGDVAWPVLVQRAGYAVAYRAVDGVDWETPDHGRAERADADERRRVADRYDNDAAHWAARVDTALTIVQEGIAAARRSLA
jgi:hypothetical protein